jgi:glycosyltransferase 2 family protein
MAPGPLAAAVGLMLLDFLLGGLRLHLWVRQLEGGVGYSVSLRTYLVNLFAAAVSPMGAASGPAQLATLARGGVRPAGAVAALLLNFVGILSAMLLVGALAGGYLLSTTDVAASVGGLQRGLVVVALALPLLLVPLILNPRGGPRVAAWVTAAGEQLGGRAGGWARRLGSLIDRASADYAASIRMIRGRWWSSLGAGALLSVGMLLNKCAVGLLVGRGLGVEGHYLGVVARQAVQISLLYFSPTPGGSGVAEASVPMFMAGVVPETHWAAFALVWRAVTSYLGVAVGAVAALVAFAPGPTDRSNR